MPEEFARYGESFARLHPAWEMKLWTEDNLPKLKNQAQFEAAESFAQKADILRYELLLRFGGVYLDTDFEGLKPLDGLLSGVRAFSASEDAQWISIGIMGSVPGYPLFSAVVDDLPRALAARPQAPINEQTGPLFFTRVVTARKLKQLDSDFVVYPPALFYPYTIGQEHRRNGPFPEAYAVHHWAGSWLKNRPNADARPREAVVMREEREPIMSSERGPARVLLGFDPEQPQAALSVLLSFHRLFGPGEMVELSIYAYAEPSLSLLECIQALMKALVGDPDQTASISLLSRAELSELDYRCAYFSRGDEIEDAAAMASVIAELHAIRAELGGATKNRDKSFLSREEVLRRAMRKPGLAKPGTNSGSIRGANSSEAAAGRSSPDRSVGNESPRTEVPAVCGTGLGDGRVLTKTKMGYPILSSAHDLSLTPELLLHGQYDVALTRFLEMRLAPGQVAFDVGANIGLFSVHMARLVTERGWVVAYEAVPDNYRYLVDNISMNYLSGQCTLLQEAAWDTAEELTFVSPQQFRGNGSISVDIEAYKKRYPGDLLREIRVKAVPVEQQLQRFDRVALVKLDVEGAEYRVLKGMEESLRSGRIQCVVFECLSTLLGADFDRLVDYLGELERVCGLRTHTIDHSGTTRPLPLSVLAAQGNFTQVALLPHT